MANEDSVYNENQCGGEGGGHVDEQFDILLVKALIYLSRWKDHHLVVLQKISNHSFFTVSYHYIIIILYYYLMLLTER